MWQRRRERGGTLFASADLCSSAGPAGRSAHRPIASCQRGSRRLEAERGSARGQKHRAEASHPASSIRQQQHDALACLGEGCGSLMTAAHRGTSGEMADRNLQRTQQATRRRRWARAGTGFCGRSVSAGRDAAALDGGSLSRTAGAMMDVAVGTPCRLPRRPVSGGDRGGRRREEGCHLRRAHACQRHLRKRRQLVLRALRCRVRVRDALDPLGRAPLARKHLVRAGRGGWGEFGLELRWPRPVRPSCPPDVPRELVCRHRVVTIRGDLEARACWGVCPSSCKGRGPRAEGPRRPKARSGGSALRVPRGHGPRRGGCFSRPRPPLHVPPGACRGNRPGGALHCTPARPPTAACCRAGSCSRASSRPLLPWSPWGRRSRRRTRTADPQARSVRQKPIYGRDTRGGTRAIGIEGWADSPLRHMLLVMARPLGHGDVAGQPGRNRWQRSRLSLLSPGLDTPIAWQTDFC